MSKKVAVQSNLKEIKEELRKLGYQVNDIEQSQNPDAIVYMSTGEHISYKDMTSGLEMDNANGAILINAEGKSIDDIQRIINSRIYSPLF